jgi:hypothetical protein
LRALDSTIEQIFFDLDTLTVVYAASGWSGRVRAVGDAFLIEASVAATLAGTVSVGVITATSVPVDNTIPSYTGDTAQGFDLRYIQVEAGSFATSYIPTTTAAVARLRDDVRPVGQDNIDLFGNNVSGSVFTEFQLSAFAPSLTMRLWEVAIAGNTNPLRMCYIDSADKSLSFAENDAVGTSSTADTTNSVMLNSTQKAMVAWSASALWSTLNGGTPATVGTRRTQAAIVGAFGNTIDGVRPSNSNIRKIEVYKPTLPTNQLTLKSAA